MSSSSIAVESSVAAAKNARRYELDWLRVILTALVVLFHSAMIFSAWGYYVKNDPLFATAALRARLDRMIALKVSALADPPQIQAAGAKAAIPDAQMTAFAAIAASRARVVVRRGEIGNGRNYYGSTLESMAALGNFIHALDFRIEVIAPNQKLAQAIATGSGVPSETLPGYLAAPPPSSTLLVVDRASIANPQEAARLLDQVETSDSRLIVVGTPRQSVLATAFVVFLDQWFMMLFFLISGASTWYALGFRTARQYAGERITRIFVPFVFGCMVIVPPLVYFGLLTRPGFESSYPHFYRRFLDLPPNGYFEWGHLWFLIYLFVYSLLALPLFFYLRTGQGRKLIDLVANIAANPAGVFLFAIPLIAIEASLRVAYPNGNQNLTHDWANFLLYLTYFVYGYIIASNVRFGAAIDRVYPVAFAFGLAGMSLILGLWLTGHWPDYYYAPIPLVYQGFRGFDSWCWVVAMLGLARRYLNFTNPILRYTGPAAYPVYIVHQTIVVVAGYYVVRLSAPVPIKFALIAAATLAGSLAIYDLARRNPVTRFLFGLKAGAR